MVTVKNNFKKDVIVNHDKFGAGKIVSIDDKYMSVQFEDGKIYVFSRKSAPDFLAVGKTDRMIKYEELAKDPKYKAEDEKERLVFDKVKEQADYDLKISYDRIELAALESREWFCEAKNKDEVFEDFSEGELITEFPMQEVFGISKNEDEYLKKQFEITRLKRVLEEINQECVEIANNPYFARFDVRDDGRDQAFYIGKHALKGHVIDWRDKKASVYYQHRMYINNEITKLLLLRSFDIAGGKYYGFEELFADGKEGNSIKFDERLLTLIEDARADKGIHDIIATIQQNQYKMITHDYDSDIVVNGCAGSGKTMVLFHRLASMAFNKIDFNPENVLVIAPNRFLLKDFDELSEILSIKNVKRRSAIELYNQLMQLAGAKIGERIRHYVDRSGDGDLAMYDEARLSSCAELAKKIYSRVNSLFGISPKEVKVLVDYLSKYSENALSAHLEQMNGVCEKWKKKLSKRIENYDVDGIKSAQKALTDAKERLRIFSELYESVRGNMRGVSNAKAPNSELKTVCESLSALAHAMESDLTEAAVYAISVCSELCQNSELLSAIRAESFALAQGVIKYALVKELGVDEKSMYASIGCAFASLYCLVKISGLEIESQQLVCIDEYQNYSLAELELLSQVFPKAKFNLYGDYKQSMCEKGVGFDESLNKWSKSLADFYINENYRNAKEITEFINREFSMSMTPIGVHGEVDEVSHSDVKLELSYGDRTALIYKDKNALDKIALESKLNADDVNYVEKSGVILKNKLNVIECSQVKGLEFESVYVLPDGMTPGERYVAYTRALSSLVIVK